MRAVHIAASTLLLLGCQTVLGFRPFGRASDDDAGTSGDGASVDAAAGSNVAMGARGGASDGSPSSVASGGAGGRAPSNASQVTAGGAQAPGGGAPSGGARCIPSCGGLETSVRGLPCDEQGNFRCEGSTAQCNPKNGRCLALDVDATEVTMKDYLAWTATDPRWPDAPEACAWKHDDYAPDSACLGSTASDVLCTLDAAAGCDAGDTSCAPRAAPPCSASMLPVVCVDWCDAYAYCAAHGRRLCGDLLGGPTPLASATLPGESQWMNACSAAGQFTYASGNESPPIGTCTYAAPSLYPVGENDRCHSPSPGYSQFQDMSGNAAEWEDACDLVNESTPGKDDRCAVRGGSYLSLRSGISCDTVETLLRHETRYDVGFRCCG